jgi:hypothetical protein
VNRAYGKPIGALDYLIALEQAALLVLALLGLRSAPRRTWPLALAAVFVFVAYLAVVARLRYVIPMMPIVLLFAAIAINGIGGAWARNPFRASAQ